MRDVVLRWLTVLSSFGYRVLAAMLLLSGADVAGAHGEMILRAPVPIALPPGLHFSQAPPPSLARPLQAPSAQDPGAQCRRAAQLAGRAAGVPEHLMSAIARVESGRRGADGQVQPWPWSINVAGVDHVFDTKDQAILAVRAFQAQGIRSIDVGCMQVNLMHHPTAFASLDQAFDPAANAAYAARFLLQLFAQSGSWAKATADYHSATPELGTPYQQKVMQVLPQEMLADARQAAAPIATALGGGLVRPPMMMLGSAPVARVITTGPMIGRGLEAYRAAPVRLTTRMVR